MRKITLSVCLIAACMLAGVEVFGNNPDGAAASGTQTQVHGNNRDITIGANSIYNTGEKLTGDKIRISVGQASIVYLKVDCNKLEIDAGSGSIVEVKGNCNDLSALAGEGCIFNARSLKSNNVDLEAQENSIVSIKVRNMLSGSAQAGSIVQYKGKGKLGRFEVDGSSIVKK